jgi:ferritin-like metal-binding protein YciE
LEQERLSRRRIDPATGRADCAALHEENLKEEKAADIKLTGLAERGINAKAA